MRLNTGISPELFGKIGTTPFSRYLHASVISRQRCIRQIGDDQCVATTVAGNTHIRILAYGGSGTALAIMPR